MEYYKKGADNQAKYWRKHKNPNHVTSSDSSLSTPAILKHTYEKAQEQVYFGQNICYNSSKLQYLCMEMCQYVFIKVIKIKVINFLELVFQCLVVPCEPVFC